MFLRRHFEAGAGAGEGGGTPESFTPEQVQEKVQEAVNKYKTENPFTIAKAAKLIEEGGGMAFMTKDAYESKLKEIHNEYHGKYSTLHEKNFAEITGIPKNEGEQLKDYIERLKTELPSKMQNGTSEAEFKALQGKLKEKDSKIGEWETKYNQLNENIVTQEKQSLIQKGIPVDKLDYDDYAKKGIVSNIQSEVQERFEFKKDDKGWVAIDKNSKEPILSDQGTRQSIDKVVEAYVLGQQGLKFKNGKQPNLPPNGSGQLSDEAKKLATEKYEEEKNAKGIWYDHEEGAAVLRKKYGITKPSDKETFPQLFK